MRMQKNDLAAYWLGLQRSSLGLAPTVAILPLHALAAFQPKRFA